MSNLLYQSSPNQSENVQHNGSIASNEPIISRKETGWKGLSSLEKSLSVALGLVSVLAIALSVAVIVVGLQLNKDDYKPPEKATEATQYPPWVSTIYASTTPPPNEVTTRVRPTTILTSTTETSDGTTQQCVTDQCINIVQSLNVLADPCNDFYNFACGGWEKQNPPSQDNPIVDESGKRQKAFKLDIKNILQSENFSELDAVNLARQFYNTCLTDSNNASIRQLIESYVGEIGSLENENLIPLLSKIRGEFGGNYIFSLWIDIHLEYRDQNAIYLGHPDFDVANYMLNFDNETIRALNYREFMLDLWTNVFFEEDANITEGVVDDIIELEQNLMKISTLNFSEDTLMNVRIINGSKLQINEDNLNKYEKFVNIILSSLLESCLTLNTTSYGNIICNDIDNNMELIVIDIEYYSKIEKLLTETPINTTVNYLKWRILLDFAKHASERYRNLYNQKIIGLQNPQPRWEMCVDESIKYFGPALTAVYIEDNLSDHIEFKQRIAETVEFLKHTLLGMTKEFTWITSNETRSRILEKLNDMQIFAVYPLSLQNENITLALEYYDDLNFTNPSSHFQNILDLTKWESETELNLILRNTNDTMLYKELEVQASTEIGYSRLTNSLYLPTAALGSLLFTHKENESLAFTYGSFGTRIARQLIEAFEGSAMEYKNGSVTEVWDSETVANFRNSIDCIKDEHNTTGMGESNASDERVVRLNSMDVGGLSLALNSYFYIKRMENDDRIFGLDEYSPLQLFFLGFAQNLCATYTNASFVREVIEGSQTPVPYRVNSLLDNFPQFAEAWNCTKPVEIGRCQLW